MEIERKFLVHNLPDLSGLSAIPYERYYLKADPEFEDRVQRVGSIYERETKVRKSELERTSHKTEISQEEFERLRTQASSAIIRDSYLISEQPEVTIKIYHGQYEGLVRAEVEFNSVEEARAYTTEEWMGEEITESPLGRDSQLLQLSQQEFRKLLGL